MKNCPECNSRQVRISVSLFLDIPGDLDHGLSKSAIRDARVKVTGAGWPAAAYRCEKCGWFMRGDRTDSAKERA